MCVIYCPIVRKSLLIDVNQSLKPIFFVPLQEIWSNISFWKWQRKKEDRQSSWIAGSNAMYKHGNGAYLIGTRGVLRVHRAQPF